MAEYYVDSNKEVTLLAGATDNHYNANISFDNINDTARNIANWSNNITNCITYIPQDIKLELNNGTLTLKAGSKLYKPNGFESDGTTPKFDIVVTTEDVTGLGWYSTSSSKNQMVFVRTDGLAIDSTVYTSSGTSYPSSHSNGDRCYRTDLNLLYTFRTSNNQWNLEDCLPIAVVQPSSTEAGKVASIDQVFNGFGYIGSTVFALPGVKGLIPNGRNADGTLKSTPFEVQNVITHTSSGRTDAVYFCVGPDILLPYTKQLFHYDKKENKNVNDSTKACVNLALCGQGKYNSSIQFATFNQPFHALDYNDTSYISTQSCPSDRYIDLSLLASGSTYTAPANGWVNVVQVNSSLGQLNLYSNKSIGSMVMIPAGSGSKANLKVCKGDVFYYGYSGRNTSAVDNMFRFIYDNGEV